MARTTAASKRKNPVFEIVMDTNAAICGELYPAAAPNTVGNFIYLANQGFYDGLTFHRCIHDFIIQGGKPLKELPYCIRGEFEFNGDRANRQPHQYGSLSMSRSNHYNSGSSQFFIVITHDQREMSYLDGAYAVFGKVTDGIKAVEAIGQVETDLADTPLQPQIIRRVRVETFGAEYPFETIPPPDSPVNTPIVKRHDDQKQDS